ncbi:MAG: macro domain-containing protein [Nitrosopumilaceae archaeon]|jgi:O-acetyl-ADP-ribose deacetylase (regulator of RNase III)
MIKKQIHNKIFVLTKSDITERNVDAIVNAANSHLLHGGGVAGTIVRKGGRVIQEESNKIDYVPTGSAVITGAGRLQCNYVIHAVGPQMGEGEEDSKLKNVIQSIMKLANEKNFSSISIPAISSGIFGFPKDKCATILIEGSLKFLKENPDTSVQLIEFCILDDETYKYFETEFNLIDKK